MKNSRRILRSVFALGLSVVLVSSMLPIGNVAYAAPPSEASSATDPVLASQALDELWVDGTNGDDANDGSASAMVKTLGKALERQATDPSITTIHVKGDLALSATATIPSGVTLSIAADGAKISGSGNSIDGIVLASGATLTGEGTLTMTGFKTALTA